MLKKNQKIQTPKGNFPFGVCYIKTKLLIKIIILAFNGL